MTGYIQRIELLDLNNPTEKEIAHRLVGLSLKQVAPLSKVTIDDATPEGKKKISDLLAKGWKVESIKN